MSPLRRPLALSALVILCLSLLVGAVLLLQQYDRARRRDNITVVGWEFYYYVVGHQNSGKPPVAGEGHPLIEKAQSDNSPLADLVLPRFYSEDMTYDDLEPRHLAFDTWPPEDLAQAFSVLGVVIVWEKEPVNGRRYVMGNDRRIYYVDQETFELMLRLCRILIQEPHGSETWRAARKRFYERLPTPE